MFPRKSNKSSVTGMQSRGPMAVVAILVGLSPLSAAQAGEIMEICVEAKDLSGGYGAPECYYVSAGDISHNYAMMGFADYAASSQAGDGWHKQSSMFQGRGSYADEDWKQALPSAALWVVAFKAPGASNRRNRGNRLFLDDNLRHGRPNSGIGALSPNTARDGLPLESVGFRLQIAY